MAVSAFVFTSCPTRAYSGSIGALGAAAGTTFVCLVADAGSVEKHQEDWTSYSDITNQVTGTGYTAGGQVLAGRTLVGTNRVTTFDANDSTWGTSTITAKYAVVYNYGPGSSLIMCENFGTNYVSSNGSFTITWGANGIFTETVAGTT